jgi:catechol 2,3-dioxygenase-like lactoylglutathione lyase family enzyme
MVKCLSRIEMICDNARALATFYQVAFGFLEMERPDGRTDGIHHSIRMQLGIQEIALIDVRPRGRPYPADVAGWNPLFQHIAIVVSNMSNAYERLSTIPGWSPISTAGPQLLPPASGRVTAFKFRDPEGHPLEFIAFAPAAIPAQWQTNSGGDCLGIDHSALSVANTARSVAFYESLGLIRSRGSLNIGPEQAKLDDLPNAVVEVTPLTPAQSTPHVELLCYRGDFDRHVQQRTNDATATRLVLSVQSRDAFNVLCASHSGSLVKDSVAREDDALRVLLRDPDGHLVCLETGT